MVLRSLPAELSWTPCGSGDSAVDGILPDGINPWSIGLFAAVGLVLLAVGAGAAWLPAMEAANVDPALPLKLKEE
jgi:hypothetical protein